MTGRVKIEALTKEQAAQLESQYAQSGAVEIQIEQQSDGRYALSFLPGDPDFPTESDRPSNPSSPGLPDAPSLDGDPDFKTD